MSGRTLAPGSAVAVCSLFLSSFLLAGLWVGGSGVEYRLFSLVDGLAALIILYMLISARVLSWSAGVWGFILLAYAAAATAQLLALLLPPPGVLEWVVLGALLVFAWNVGYGIHRTRLLLGLGLVAVGLAALKYSVLPFIWSRTQLPETPLLNLRGLGDQLRGLFIAYTPPRPITQLFAFAAVLAWSLAVWLQWPAERRTDWLQRLSRADRDRLLFGLLAERSIAGRELGSEEVRAYLGRAELDESQRMHELDD